MTDKAKETKELILKVSIEEFGEKGFLAASTNNIAKQAGVSKGIIFHYYQNKRNLYVSCVKFGLEGFTAQIKQTDFGKEKDIFDRIFYLSKQKISLYHQHGHLGRLLIGAYEAAISGSDSELKEYFEKAIQDSIDQFMMDLDTSVFAEDLNEREAIVFIVSTITSFSTNILRSYQNCYQEILLNIETVYAQLNGLIRMIKYGVYKPR